MSLYEQKQLICKSRNYAICLIYSVHTECMVIYYLYSNIIVVTKLKENLLIFHRNGKTSEKELKIK